MGMQSCWMIWYCDFFPFSLARRINSFKERPVDVQTQHGVYLSVVPGFQLTGLFQRERNMFIERLQQYALSRRIRISFLTGDVHCASVGRLKTLSKGKRTSVLEATSDHRYMLNIVSSMLSPLLYDFFMSR
jgi:hypothetical protein